MTNFDTELEKIEEKLKTNKTVNESDLSTIVDLCKKYSNFVQPLKLLHSYGNYYAAAVIYSEGLKFWEGLYETNPRLNLMAAYQRIMEQNDR